MEEAGKRPGCKRLAIGIDPPSGLAVWNLDTKKFDALMPVTFWDIIHTFDMILGHYDFYVVCEAPQKNQPVWIDGKSGVTNRFKYAKVCQNVGQNKQCSILIIEWCERNHVKVITQKPGRHSHTKLTHDEFCFRTGWPASKRTNEHTRDAGMLVFGL